ncbi:hypothetical protein PIB30_048366 [Stylosanthes scabra]|uniref:Uncharacterized protein n=1 Tax=Stylosanthes scabra TaxID=79078 RepID=A0ABU6UGD6_9FABA|nr:hypothetical protein [Stylosanthes scabra]
MEVRQVWQTVKEAIVAYMGLAPTTFFTPAAILFAVYYVVSVMLGLSSYEDYPRHGERDMEEEQMTPLKPPVQIGEVTEEELKAYDGSDPEKPLLMVIKVRSVMPPKQGRFGNAVIPGEPPHNRLDASRALAKMSFEEKDLTGDIFGLGPFEIDA